MIVHNLIGSAGCVKDHKDAVISDDAESNKRGCHGHQERELMLLAWAAGISAIDAEEALICVAEGGEARRSNDQIRIEASYEALANQAPSGDQANDWTF